MSEILTSEVAPLPLPQPQQRGIEVHDRLIGEIGAADRGPTLIAVAGLHGNEPAGVHALRRVCRRLGDGGQPMAGRLVAFAGNMQALREGRRYLQHDLNRAWKTDDLIRLRNSVAPLTFEDEEMLQLDHELTRVIEGSAGAVYLLDLHTTSGPGPAFAVLEDTLPNRNFALSLPVPLVLGIEEEIEGTLSNHLYRLGVTTVGFEGGQHEETPAIDRAEAAIWLTLHAAGVLAGSYRPEVAAAQTALESDSDGLPHVVEVRHRHPVSASDGFHMAEGFVTFQPIRSGQRLGEDSTGPVQADEDGLILMPLYQEQGEDGYFIVRPVRGGWLTVSTICRRLHLERLLPLLPGVHRHPDRQASYAVNRRIARWLTHELFHLLGYRCEHATEETSLMTRRAHDR